jgi:hypothetical protein
VSIVPKLRSLRFEIEELRAGGSIETAHVRPIVVSRAPALFFFPCHDSTCKDGGHDITAEICNALRAGRERFEGEDRCSGQTANADCGRILKYVATATYEPE